jgi:ABC-type amino acid transport substrate-binding protein
MPPIKHNRTLFQQAFAALALLSFSHVLCAAPTMKFNILDSYPFAYTDAHGEQVGTYWEYIETIEKRLSFNIDQQSVPKARVVAHLKLGVADAAILFRSEKMSPFVEFVSKIRDIPIAIVSRKNLSITQYEQLHDLEYVGHFRSGSVSTRFDVDAQINKVALNTYPQMIEMLQKGRVSAIVGNAIVLRSLLARECLEQQLTVSPLTLGTKEQWLVMSKKSTFLEYRDDLEQAFDEAKAQGLLDQIFHRHLSLKSKRCNYASQT